MRVLQGEWDVSSDVRGLATWTDDRLWEYLSDRLTPNNDWAELLQDELIPRIVQLLKMKFSEVSTKITQLERDRAQYRSPQEYERVRMTVRRHARLIQARLTEGNPIYKTYRQQRHQQREEAVDRASRTLLRRLARAVAAHRAGFDHAEPTENDLLLWAVLDEQLPGTIPADAPTLGEYAAHVTDRSDD